MARPKVGLTDAKRERFEQAAHMQLNRFTIPQIARELGMPERTLRRQLNSSEYVEFFRTYQREFKEQAEAVLASLGDQVVRGMAELALGETRSEMARFQALKALGDWIGLGQTKPEQDDSTKEDLKEIHDLLEARRERARLDASQWIPSTAASSERPIEPLEGRTDAEDAEVRLLPG